MRSNFLFIVSLAFFACAQTLAMDSINLTLSNGNIEEERRTAEEILHSLKSGKNLDKACQFFISSISKTGYHNVLDFQRQIFKLLLLSDFDWGTGLVNFIDSKIRSEDDNDKEIALICGRLYADAMGYIPAGLEEAIFIHVINKDNPYLIKIGLEIYLFVLGKGFADWQQACNFAVSTLNTDSEINRVIGALAIVKLSLDFSLEEKNIRKIQAALGSQNMSHMFGTHDHVKEKWAELFEEYNMLNATSADRGKNESKENCVIS